MRRYYREFLAGSALAVVMSASAAQAQVVVPYSNGQINPATIVTDRNFGTFLVVNPGDAAEQTGPIVDGAPPIFPVSAPVVFFGNGTLTLSGNNTYSSGTVINGGTLIAGSDTAFGTGVVNVNASATIGYLDGVTINNLIALPPFSETTLTLNVASGSATQAGQIGAVDPRQSIAKTGAGTLFLPNANPDFRGSVQILDGTLAIGSSTSLGDGSLYALGTVYLNGGTLQAAADGLTVENPFLLIGVGGAVDTNGYTLTISGNIGDTGPGPGSGPLTKVGAGTLVLSGNGSSYSHGTFVEEGTVAITNAAALGKGEVFLEGGNLLGAPVAPADTIGLLNDIIVSGASGIAATTGTTLALQGDFDFGTPGSVTTFGSADHQGTVSFEAFGVGFDDTASFVVAGGTLKDGNGSLGLGVLPMLASTTVNAGATLDLSGSVLPAIRNLKEIGRAHV